MREDGKRLVWIVVGVAAIHFIILMTIGSVITYTSSKSSGFIAGAGDEIEESIFVEEEETFAIEEPMIDFEAESLMTTSEDVETPSPIVAEGPSLDYLSSVVTESLVSHTEFSTITVPDGLDALEVGAVSTRDGSTNTSQARQLSQIAQNIGNSKISFFGITEQASRIVILFDVSQSVVTKAEKLGVSVEKIKDETLQVLTNLSKDSHFGLIQFVRNYKRFNENLLSATSKNKREAKKWIQEKFITSGSMPGGAKDVIQEDPNGIQSVLKAAFGWNPDVIYLLTDGSFYRGRGMNKVPYVEIEGLLEELQEKRPHKVRLHVISFQMYEEDKISMRRMISRTGGRLTEM